MKSIRETFLPDPGCIFVRIDLSQVEHRYCLMYTQAPRLVEIANLKPNVYDGHTDNAKMIFGKDTITKQERHLGKITSHAAERDMQGPTMSENILKETDGELYITPKQCDKMLESFHRGMPEIRGSYFTWARDKGAAAINDGVPLRNSWGRMVDLKGHRMTAELLREIYSFYMQSENADHMAQYGMIPAYHFFRGYDQRCTINVPVHDELVISSPPECAYIVAAFVVSSLERPREILGNKVVIPAEVVIGKNWGDKRNEWKSLPGKAKFDEKAFELMGEIKDGK